MLMKEYIEYDQQKKKKKNTKGMIGED